MPRKAVDLAIVEPTLAPIPILRPEGWDGAGTVRIASDPAEVERSLDDVDRIRAMQGIQPLTAEERAEKRKPVLEAPAPATASLKAQLEALAAGGVTAHRSIETATALTKLQMDQAEQRNAMQARVRAELAPVLSRVGPSAKTITSMAKEFEPVLERLKDQRQSYIDSVAVRDWAQIEQFTERIERVLGSFSGLTKRIRDQEQVVHTAIAAVAGATLTRNESADIMQERDVLGKLCDMADEIENDIRIILGMRQTIGRLIEESAQVAITAGETSERDLTFEQRQAIARQLGRNSA